MKPHEDIQLLHSMLRIRRMEETIADVYPQGGIRTPTHLSIGQEGIAVGVCAALRKDDQIFSSHRGHAHYLAKGGDAKRFMAELYGRETGCSRGRGGSVHLIDTAMGVMGTSAILGGSVALAVGAAFSMKHDGLSSLAVAFHGDAVMEEGISWESFNLALLYHLPMLFICENNQYSTNTHIRCRQNNIPIHQKVKALGLNVRHVDGNDVRAVRTAALELAAECRAGKPGFLEADTYRIREHVGPLYDYSLGFRSKEEVESWMQKCPIKRLRESLLQEKAWTEAEQAALEDRVNTEVREALAFAEKSPWPKPESILENTY